MKVYANASWMQKAGNADSEFEDAFWPRTLAWEEPLPTRIAVADGATDAVYSGLWARLLVRGWGKRRLDQASFRDGVSRQGRIWQRAIRHRKLPWYVEEKARTGTYAAFVGLDLDQTPGLHSGSWTAIACGDCCVFQIRGPDLLKAFPVTQSSDFSSSPLLLGTNTNENNDATGIQIASGTWEAGDYLYLMSDALASWFLASCETGSVPWRLLRNIAFSGKPTFEGWIGDLRRLGKLKNDDCTMIIATFE